MSESLDCNLINLHLAIRNIIPVKARYLIPLIKCISGLIQNSYLYFHLTNYRTV
jgi:hypothetical protein